MTAVGIVIAVFVAGMLLLVAAVLVGAWWLIVVPVLRETGRAVRARDPWVPWLRRDDGSWGPLTANHWWSAGRAETRGGRPGLVLRWGFWLVQSVLLTVAVGSGLAGLVRLGALGLSRS
ncbi:hypothetical protein KMZ32_00930 [Phycicoccus sp. MAQZ13P-2]|uniref:hypothetical protein n=1 Tax=Phycicoccus mangrovi TaxID=2840470 RepID=UPI001C004315|nr:hypothetical protein [Phycicoccus mangrovi]MBT9254255.1 hypothetical protein [Phycicoccus mangrovi]MBT9272633.1 hypothetical protein [Phycicoccus mangrovi]